MQQFERIKYLIEYLLSENNLTVQIPQDITKQKRLFRALVNVRMPKSVSNEFLRVQDEGWDNACERYEKFLEQHKNGNMLYLELGVGYNTPVIIKYPFWRLTQDNRKAVYACINLGETYCPPQIQSRSICINADIGEVLASMCKERL